MPLTTTYQEYSEFEITDFAMKFEEDEKYNICGAVGSCEETLDTKTVSKSYKGIEAKTRTRGTGTGELKISMHMAYETYCKAFGMIQENLKDGIRAYGQKSVHPTMSVTEKVIDEDGTIKYKAYPNCILKEGISRKIENGGEDVAEIEMTLSIMPDKYGNGMYEALKDSLDENTAATWMESFVPDSAQAITA